MSSLLFVVRIEIAVGLFASNIALGCPLLCLCTVLFVFVDCDGGRDIRFGGGRAAFIVLDSVCFVVELFGLGLDLRRNRFDALSGWVVDLSL